MINLLPPETKRQVRAARMNVILVNYCLLIGFTVILLGGVFAVGFLADMNDERLARNAKAGSDGATQAYASTRKQAEDFASDLKTAKTILASNVNFSQLILDIAGIVPSGVVLNSLSLGATTKDAPIDISGRAASYNAAISLKNSLEASPIFENVNIVNVSQQDLSTVTEPTPLMLQYPFTITLKAQFTKKSATSTTTEAKK